MSTSHRGLPPPAVIAAAAHPAPYHGHGPPSGHLQQGQLWSALPPPPQQWQGAEEAMRSWLVAKAEEEKTRQEEERTRQESLRLEQRRVEMDMLRASLSGGIPPPMIPLVFASMAAGGTLSQASIDWAQHFMQVSQGQQPPQLLPPQRPQSPENHPREGLHPPPPPLPPPGSGPGQESGPGSYAGPPVNPPAVPTPNAYGPYPASPARPRGQTVTGIVGRHTAGMPGQATGGPPMAQYQPPPHVQIQPVQREPSPPIFFHHWQPPTSQAGGGGGLNRPGTPSGDAHRRRKTLAQPQQQQTMTAPSEQRLRSPPAFIQSSLSNPPAGRRSHKRQRSDIAWYRPPGQGSSDEAGRAGRARAPSREADTGSPRDAYGGESKKQSVLALLSQEPAESAPLDGSRSRFHVAYSQPLSTSGRRDEEEPPRDRRASPSKGDSSLRSGGAASSRDAKRG